MSFLLRRSNYRKLLMLYQFYESQRALMEPFSEMAQSASRVLLNPMMPFSHFPYANRVSAGYDLLHRLVKNYEKPQFDITSVMTDGVEVSVHERVSISKPFCNLLRFKRYADDAATLEKLINHPAVLIVAPLSGHYATLLRDTVRTMSQHHKVYITDWLNARDVPLSEGRFNLDDYVNYVQEFIRYIQERNGECHVVSVCQPTVPVMAAVSLMAARGEKNPSSMVMMGGPIDATQSPTSVNDLANQRSIDWFENNVIYRVPSSYSGVGRRVYPGFLQYAGFVAMNPNRHATSYYDYFQNLVQGDGESAESHRRFYDEYNAVLDMDADFYLDTIQTVFQEYRLIKGTWEVTSPEGKKELVRPQFVRDTAVLAVEGELDDISGLGQTEAALHLCTQLEDEHKQYYKVMGAGHYGIFSGRRWREVCYPQVRKFILRYHEQVIPPQRLQTAQARRENLATRKKIREDLRASRAKAGGVAAKVTSAKRPAKAAKVATTAKRTASTKATAKKTTVKAVAAKKATATRKSVGATKKAPSASGKTSKTAKSTAKPAVARTRTAKAARPSTVWRENSAANAAPAVGSKSSKAKK